MKIKLTWTFSLLANTLPGQSIYSALHLNTKEDGKNKTISEIKEENTFFGSTGTEVQKTTKKLNSHYLGPGTGDLGHQAPA